MKKFFDNLLTKIIRKPFEDWLIKKMLKNSGLEKKDISQDKRTISFGLWSLARCFFEPKHELILYCLVKWYGYKCYEIKMEFNSTWCDLKSNPDKINDDYLEFEKGRKSEFEKRRDVKNKQ